MSGNSRYSQFKNNSKILVSEKEEKAEQKKALEIYPKNRALELKWLFRIKKLKSKLTIKEKEKIYLFNHCPNLEQAKLIFELFLEEKNYLTGCFIKPLAIVMMERLNYLYKRTKVYMAGEKKENFEEIWACSLKREEKNKLIGSAIFNLAKLHENRIALGDVSISFLYRKKTDSLAVFGLPSQLRVLKKKEEGYDEFILFLNNFLLNKMISKKEIEIYIEHYLKSFEKEQEIEAKKKMLLDLFYKYYTKYYKN